MQSKIAVPTLIALAPMVAAMKLLSTVTKRRNTIPILSNVAIEVTGNIVRLAATDLDTYLDVKLDAEGGATFKTTVSAYTLRDLLASIDGEQVGLTLDTEKHRLCVTGDDFAATLHTLPFDDFPVFAGVDDAPRVALSAAKLASDIAFVSPAISTEETRYYLNGIAIVGYDGELLCLCVSPENGEAEAVARGSAVPPFNFAIGFNAKYLTTIAKGFGKGQLETIFDDPSSPTLWTSPESAGRLSVLMPMRV